MIFVYLCWDLNQKLFVIYEDSMVEIINWDISPEKLPAHGDILLIITSGSFCYDSERFSGDLMGFNKFVQRNLYRKSRLFTLNVGSAEFPSN